MSTTIYTSNGKILINGSNNKWLKYRDPLNPLDLPSHTIRVRANSSFTISGATVTPVAGQSNVYDVYKESDNWSGLFRENTNITAILGANTTGVTDMSYAFYYTTFMSSIVIFDTSTVTNMSNMFRNSTFSGSLPLFDTSSATNVDYAFSDNTRITSGMLALYQQMSTQANPPTSHNKTFWFLDSGWPSPSASIQAERAQIPSSWGGTAS